jgi:hypothetical protein
MGSYASLTLGNFQFDLYKSYIKPEIMTLFRVSDKRKEMQLQEDGEERFTYKYVNTIRYIKLRLNIMGFTLEKAKDEFISNNNNKRPYFHWADENETCEIYDFTFEDWLEAMENIIKSSVAVWDQMDFLRDNKQDNTAEYFILDEHNERNSLYGFISSDFRFVLRGIIELFQDDDLCNLDYTDLVGAGYYGESDEICKNSLEDLSQKSLANQKIIILTEGSTDIAIIQQTMRVLYPDVLDYYSFMDFNTSNAPGSASSLVNYIKGFIGSGINNKIICLFDNDAAAYDAVRNLERISIPKNIKILHYPDIELAKKYPTLGPGGTINIDINGLACSIELYLGKDILSDKNINLTPIQWKGYIQSIKKYQGEILNKEEIIKKYLKFINDVKQRSIEMEMHDWDGMNKIITMIFNAFD